MALQVITQDAEARLLEIARELRHDVAANYALHFRLSQLQAQYRSDFQLKIAINVLSDVFREERGSVYFCRDGDIFVIYHGESKQLVDKAIFQLRYLFMEDPLASNADGSENDAFSAVYDLGFQWHAFYKTIPGMLGAAIKMEIKREQSKATSADQRGLNLVNLVKILDILEKSEISNALRQQPVCVKLMDKPIRPVFNEVYINIAHLANLLGNKYTLTNDRLLFKYLTRQLDKHVLGMLGEQPAHHFRRPLSININVETVLSKVFTEFCEKIASIPSSSVVFEIHISDVFADIEAFTAARDIMQKQGYRVCVDGLNNAAFMQVDRQNLGFDLAKLQWNADMKSSLSTDENRRLAIAINRCGSNRIILCRCDSIHAIEYGQALGISLFQGRHTDRELNPAATIIN